MSENKKHKKINSLASQKIDLRSRKGARKNKIQTSNNFKFNFNIKKLIYYFNKKIIYLFLLSFFSIIIIKFCAYFLEIYSEQILPNEVQIKTDNQKMTRNIHIEVNKILSQSIKNNDGRTEFLSKVNKFLSSISSVDQFWIRLGLDGKLIIDAIMQIPVLLIETKNGDIYIISNNMQIISKNPPPADYKSLLKLEAPELKINWKVNSNSLAFQVNNSINFLWLIKQTRLINSEMLKIGQGYSLTSVAWNSNTGFFLKIKKNNLVIYKNLFETNNQNNSIYENLSVIIGENDIYEKMSRLKEMLKELSNKNIFPNKIDLDYTDKATFKIQG